MWLFSLFVCSVFFSILLSVLQTRYSGIFSCSRSLSVSSMNLWYLVNVRCICDNRWLIPSIIGVENVEISLDDRGTHIYCPFPSQSGSSYSKSNLGEGANVWKLNNPMSRLLMHGFLGPNQLRDLRDWVVACTPVKTVDIITSVSTNTIYSWPQLPPSNSVEVTNSDRIGARTATKLTFRV